MSSGNKINFFTVPYEGGIAESTYAKWQAPLGERFNVIPLEPAGHGRRINEPFTDSMAATVDDLFERILPFVLHDTPWVIYGHSLGSIVAYELVRKVMAEGIQQPLGIYVSGRNGPEHKQTEPDYHVLSDKDFVEALKNIPGTPQDLFANASMIDAFLPIIRNDYKVMETYRYQQNNPTTINGFITGFLSKNDSRVSADFFRHWGYYCDGRFNVHEFPGHHFFIHDDYAAICEIIKTELL